MYIQPPLKEDIKNNHMAHGSSIHLHYEVNCFSEMHPCVHVMDLMMKASSLYSRPGRGSMHFLSACTRPPNNTMSTMHCSAIFFPIVQCITIKVLTSLLEIQTDKAITLGQAYTVYMCTQYIIPDLSSTVLPPTFNSSNAFSTSGSLL